MRSWWKSPIQLQLPASQRSKPEEIWPASQLAWLHTVDSHHFHQCCSQEECGKVRWWASQSGKTMCLSLAAPCIWQLQSECCEAIESPETWRSPNRREWAASACGQSSRDQFQGDVPSGKPRVPSRTLKQKLHALFLEEEAGLLENALSQALPPHRSRRRQRM